MVSITDEKLMSFVEGALPSEQATEVQRRAQSDPEVAATIALLASIAGASMDNFHAGISSSITRRDNSLRQRILPSVLRRPISFAAALVVLLFTIFGTAWAILQSRPLLEDNFNDRSFDAYIWMHQPEVERRFKEPMGISERNGHLRLVNRGFLVTREEFPGPISLSFDWQWVELGPYDPRYAENLTVALRTTGIVSATHPYDIEDSVRIMFNVWGPFVNIVEPIDGGGKVLGSTEDLGPLKLPIPADEWHRIQITDDGEKIIVYMSGPEIGDRFVKTPLLSVRRTKKPAKHHIAIYNRELVGNAHESLIDNLVIRALPGRD